MTVRRLKWGIEGWGAQRTDISHGGRDADFDTGVSLFCQLALEELIQFGIEDTIGDELPTLRDVSCSGSGHGCGA